METDFQIIQPHEEAAALIAGKPVLAKSVFDRLLPELRARAFTVTGIEDADVLQRIRDALAEVPRGLTWDDAKDNVVAELDPWLGDNSEQRAELLLRTQTFTAFQTSTWRAAQADEDTTHLQYLTMEDDRVRDSHAALDGVILPKDDPFWEHHYPPWEWNCRCLVRTMNEDQVQDAKEDDADKNPEDRNVITGPALKKLNEGQILRDGQAFDVSPPDDPGAFHWHPDDLRIPLDALKDRYDAQTFGQFKDFAAATRLEEDRTLLDWLQGGKLESEAPAPLRFEDAQEAMEWADANMHPDDLKLTPLQRESLVSYQLTSSGLNSALRTGNLSQMQRRQAGALDRVFKKSKAPETLTVWHGSSSAGWGALEPGDELGLTNYLSTTLAEQMTDFKGSAWVEITVPAGAPAVYMDGLDGQVDHSREVEVILSRHSRLRIISVENDGETVHVKAELIQ